MSSHTVAHVGIIGGTGMESLLSGGAPEMVGTPYGMASVTRGRLQGTPVAFLLRHGPHHALLPHEIDFRANLWALAECGVTQVLTTVAVGSLRADLAPGDLALLADFIDLTRARPSTFRGAPGLPSEAEFYHTDFQPPYCPHLRGALNAAALAQGGPSLGDATYACLEGPRYESPAEIRMLQVLAADVVGMTGLPEAILARELGLCYASIAVITNAAAGLSDEPLLHEDVQARGAAQTARVAALLGSAAGRAFPSPADCCPAAARRQRWFAGRRGAAE